MAGEEVNEPRVTYGTTDVFHDLELPHADELLAKAKLAMAIEDVIRSRGLTPVEAAKIMGIDQPKVSKIVRGQLTEFSTERLLNYLVLLGLDIDIVVHKQVSAAQGEGTIHVAYV